MHFRRFKKKSPQELAPISFILSQLCAHGAFKIIKQRCHRVCSFTHSASDHPSTPPPVVPTGRFRGPWPSLSHSIHGGARGEEPLHHGGVATLKAAYVQRCVASGAEGLGDVNGWRAPPRGSPPPTPTLAVEETANLWSEVREFNLLQNCIASWLNDLNGSHYRCWCL